MREILFRGKRKDNGEWVYGNFRVAPRYSHLCMIEDICPIVRGGISVYQGVPLVDPTSVGQYTGLTDKNGKKIFEGDIVNILTENEEIGVVIYDEAGFWVEADGVCVDFHSNINGTDLEVIGNIHDNPELLEGGDGNA